MLHLLLEISILAGFLVFL